VQQGRTGKRNKKEGIGGVGNAGTSRNAFGQENLRGRVESRNGGKQVQRSKSGKKAGKEKRTPSNQRAKGGRGGGGFGWITQKRDASGKRVCHVGGASVLKARGRRGEAKKTFEHPTQVKFRAYLQLLVKNSGRCAIRQQIVKRR